MRTDHFGRSLEFGLQVGAHNAKRHSASNSNHDVHAAHTHAEACLCRARRHIMLGDQDDPGHRKHIISVTPRNVWTSFRQEFDPRQTDLDPPLRFYGVIAIVAVAGGVPVAQLGDLVITPTLAMQ